MPQLVDILLFTVWDPDRLQLSTRNSAAAVAAFDEFQNIAQVCSFGALTLFFFFFAPFYLTASLRPFVTNSKQQFVGSQNGNSLGFLQRKSRHLTS